MKDRIRQARKDLKETQKSFGEALGLSENFIWQIEKGERVPSDRTIKDICAKFGVNETWLRTGVGDMKADTTEAEKLSAFFADVLASAPDERSAFVSALAELPPEFWPILADLAKGYAKKLKHEENGG